MWHYILRGVTEPNKGKTEFINKAYPVFDKLLNKEN